MLSDVLSGGGICSPQRETDTMHDHDQEKHAKERFYPIATAIHVQVMCTCSN